MSLFLDGEDNPSVSYQDSSSIFTNEGGDTSRIIYDSPGQTNSSTGQNENGNTTNWSAMNYMDKNDLLLKLSRIMFEDFHNHILALSKDGEAQQEESDPEETYLDMLQKFIEICECGVKGIEKVCAEGSRIEANQNTDLMVAQLTSERAAYSLILQMKRASQLLCNHQNLVSSSFLTKLFRENEQFRRISTLLVWNEENAVFSPTEFAKIDEENVLKLSELDNIYACTKIRGPVHIDSRFVDRIAAEDEEAVRILNQVLLCLLRTGRLEDAKSLLDNVGLPAQSAFIFIREFLTNPKLSPLDRFDENFNLAKSRMHFKQTARELIPMDDERILPTDQCIWATLAGHLPTLLSHAQSTEDRLWAYLSCAAEAMLDQALLDVHAQMDEQIGLMAADSKRENADSPREIHTIFKELQNNEHSSYYAIFEHLASERWADLPACVDKYVRAKESTPAHELRFFVHLLLALKLIGKPIEPHIMDRLIDQYASMLTQMKLIAIIPFYLFNLSEPICFTKMLEFLEGIIYEQEQKEVLLSAARVGYEVPTLCRDIFQRFKTKYRMSEGQPEHMIAKSAEEMLKAWKWLNFCWPETIWDALEEANYLLRKYFVYGRMAEAVELMRIAPDNLGTMAVEAFQDDFPDDEVPGKLLEAKREFDCYFLYFEAIGRYGDWQKHVEGSQPEMPTKLSDERWARMDIRRRTEYELGVQKARDCLQQYYRLVELYRKRAVEMLETVLKMADGWLVTASLSMEAEIEREVIDRAQDFVQIRRDYLANLLDLLVDIHSRSDQPMLVLDIASLIMDPEYSLYKAIATEKLQRLLTKISQSGAALL